MSTGYLSCHGYQYSSFFGNHGNHGKSVPIVHPWNCLEAVRQCNKNTLSVYPDVIPSIEILKIPCSETISTLWWTNIAIENGHL